MEEKLRIESLNGRGLRDRIKRCDFFDRARMRHTDILLLQETHWIETDYTDIKEDWNLLSLETQLQLEVQQSY